ncbi:MAG: MATE family efflux transporter [Clostridiales bacterium]|nr:MATE family efflux transporter [Clostridiales bacterium]
MAEKATLMTEGPVWRHIVRFALPVFWGNLFQQLYNVVDSLVVGNFLGSDALAAVGSSGHLIFLLVGLFSGIFTGASVVISRYFGARDEKNVTVAVHTTVAFGLTAGVVITIVGTLLTPHLLMWMGTPESVLPNSIAYFRIYFSGVVFVVLYNTAAGIFQAVGDSRHPLYYLIISSITNVALDLLFVAVLGMGVEGAALATVLSQAASASMGFYRLCHATGVYRVWPKKVRFNWRMLKQVLTLGIPSGVQNSIIGIANVVVQSSINLYGAMAVAGCGAYSKIEGFGFLPINSFALALATFIGQNLGAKEYARARRGALFGVVSCITLAEVVGVAINLLAPYLIAMFNSDPQVVAYGALQARTVTLFYFLLAFSHSIAGIMRGAGRAIVPMLVMLVCWCVIRVSYIMLVARSSGDIQMIFWAYPITWSLSSVAFLFYYLRADWPHYLEKKAAQA